MDMDAHDPPEPKQSPRVWLVASAFSPLGYSVATQALRAGDSVAAGCTREEIEAERKGHSESAVERSMAALKKLGGRRCVVVELDVRNISLCQSALAETLFAFSRVDVLLNNTSRTYVGPLEHQPPTAVLDQFSSTYFGPVNMMRSVLPCLRKQRNGHIINVTGLTGHMGIPGLAARCASDHALEGFSDSLAFEVAPFNVKITIVQPPVEVNVLSSPVYLHSTDHTYTDPSHPFSALYNLVSSTTQQALTASSEELVADTATIILAISGVQNPPGRIVVGSEGVETVKERLKLVSEELEEFLDVSLSVDIPVSGGGRNAQTEIT